MIKHRKRMTLGSTETTNNSKLSGKKRIVAAWKMTKNRESKEQHQARNIMNNGRWKETGFMQYRNGSSDLSGNKINSVRREDDKQHGEQMTATGKKYAG